MRRRPANMKIFGLEVSKDGYSPSCVSPDKSGGAVPAGSRSANTGQLDLRTTCSATLPISTCASPVCPCVPITIKSAPRFSLNLRMGANGVSVDDVVLDLDRKVCVDELAHSLDQLSLLVFAKLVLRQ